MSSANVLPRAPGYEVAETQALYPQLPIQRQFLVAKNKWDFNLSEEQGHAVSAHGKKYKKIKSALHFTAVGAGVISVILSSVSMGTVFAGIGVGAFVPLAAVCATFGAGSSGLALPCPPGGVRICDFG